MCYSSGCKKLLHEQDRKGSHCHRSLHIRGCKKMKGHKHHTNVDGGRTASLYGTHLQEHPSEHGEGFLETKRMNENPKRVCICV